MKIIKGDLITMALEGDFDVIIHGCNCQCVMGAGIAKSIKKAFPEAYDADRATRKGDRAKLGTISVASIQRENVAFTVVNGYTQFHYFGVRRLVDYDAVRSVMSEVRIRFSDKRIGYPMIGAGLARGDWDILSEIIEQELSGLDHTLVKYRPK